MRKPSTNLTLNEGIKNKARELMEAQSFESMTALVEQLIRDEYDRRKIDAKKSVPAVYPPSSEKTDAIKLNERQPATIHPPQERRKG